MDSLVTLEDLMSRQFPEQTWLVDKLIPTDGITILSGPPASFKTWLTLHTAICIASGKPLFDNFKVSQGGVLVIDEENSPRLLQERVFRLGALADLPIYFSGNPGFVLNDENVGLLLLNCKAYEVKLVIIDSLVRIHTSDENSAGDMAEVFRQLRQLTARGITVLVTHHNRKPGAGSNGVSNEMRGSSDILASIDCHIGTKRKDKSLTLYQSKNRYSEELEPFEIRIVADDESFSFEYQGEIAPKVDKDQAIKAAIVQLLSEERRLFQKELLSSLNELGAKTNEHKLRELLKQMLVDGVIAETAGQGKTKLYSLGETQRDE